MKARGYAVGLGMLTAAVLWAAPAGADSWGTWRWGGAGGVSSTMVNLPPGSKHTFVLCVDAASADTVFWASPLPLKVKIAWNKWKSDLAYGPWAGQAPVLPLATAIDHKAMGPKGKLEYCGPQVVVKHADFPSTGPWMMKACLPNTSAFPCLTTQWDVKPKTLQAPKSGPATQRAKPIVPPPKP